jgi:hypothetical protein
MPPVGSLTWRAVIALALMVDFYALALSMVVLPLDAYAASAYLRFSFPLANLAIFCLIGAFIILKSVVPWPDRFARPGPALAPERHPRLFAEIRRTAESAGQPMPAEVYLSRVHNRTRRRRGGGRLPASLRRDRDW